VIALALCEKRAGSVCGSIERRRGQVPTGAAGSCTEVLIDMSNKVKDQTPMLCFVGVCWFGVNDCLYL
jgi:hypothetical protein